MNKSREFSETEKEKGGFGTAAHLDDFAVAGAVGGHDLALHAHQVAALGVL